MPKKLWDRKHFLIGLIFMTAGIILLIVSAKIADVQAITNFSSVQLVDKRAELDSISLETVKMDNYDYLPLRDVCLFYRIDFTYDPVKKITILKKDTRTVDVRQNHRKFVIGERKVKIERPVVIVNNKMMIPVGGLAPFLTELLVTNVIWDKSARTLTVNKSDGAGTDFWGNVVKEEEKGEGIIKPGDVLTISAWQKGAFGLDELTRERKVSPDGMVNFPFIGKIRVKGLALSQMEEMITKKIGPYIKDPEVTVDIAGKGARYSVQIFGKVRTPGLYEFDEKTTVMEAINKAGGFADGAKLTQVKVTRFIHHSPYETETVNCKAILEKGRRENDIPIENKDIIFVPETKGVWGGINSEISKVSPVVSFTGIIIGLVLLLAAL